MERSSEQAKAKELEVQQLKQVVDGMKRELHIAKQHAKTCEQLLRMETKHSSSEPAASHVSYSDREARRTRADEAETLHSLKQEHERFRATVAQQKTEIEHLKDERTALTRIRLIVSDSLDHPGDGSWRIESQTGMNTLMHSHACW